MASASAPAFGFLPCLTSCFDSFDAELRCGWNNNINLFLPELILVVVSPHSHRNPDWHMCSHSKPQSALFRELLFLLLKGIYTIFKYFLLYIFIKPILFLYHHVVVPIGKGLRFIFTRIYKYIILPPFRGIAFVIKKIGLFFKLIYAKILTPIGHFFLTIFRTISKGISFIFKKIYHFITFIAKLLYHKLLLPIWRCIVIIFKKIGFFIQWISLKIYVFLKAMVLFIYNKLLYPIFYFVYIICV